MAMTIKDNGTIVSDAERRPIRVRFLQSCSIPKIPEVQFKADDVVDAVPLYLVRQLLRWNQVQVVGPEEEVTKKWDSSVEAGRKVRTRTRASQQANSRRGGRD